MRTLFFLILFLVPVFGQTLEITPNTVTVDPVTPAHFSLTLKNAGRVAALQFTVSYTGAALVKVAPGSAASGKSFVCNVVSDGTKCAIIGFDLNSILSGEVATVSVTLPPSLTSSSISIKPSGSDASGKFIEMPVISATINQRIVARTRKSNERPNTQDGIVCEPLVKIGDKAKCTCVLPSAPMESGWYTTFTSRTDLVRPFSADPIWVEKDQKSFDFLIELVDYPKLDKWSAIVVGSSDKESKAVLGFVRVAPQGGGK